MHGCGAKQDRSCEVLIRSGLLDEPENTTRRKKYAIANIENGFTIQFMTVVITSPEGSDLIRATEEKSTRPSWAGSSAR